MSETFARATHWRATRDESAVSLVSRSGKADLAHQNVKFTLVTTPAYIEVDEVCVTPDTVAEIT